MAVRAIRAPKIAKYRFVGRWCSTCSMWPPVISRSPVPLDQIEQREEEDPDDVDEVPVEAEDLDRRVPFLRELAAYGHPQDHRQDTNPDDHVERVHARQREVDEKEEPDLTGDRRQVMTLRHIEEASRREERDGRAVRQMMADDLDLVFEVLDDQEDETQDARQHEHRDDRLLLALLRRVHGERHC